MTGAAPPPDDLRARVVAACPEAAGAPWVVQAGGRVNRVWRVGPVMVKLPGAGENSPLFPNDPALEALALRHLAPIGLAPRLRADLGGALVYDRMPGRPWRRGPAVAARALAALHAGAPGPPFPPRATGGAAVLASAVAIARGLPGAAPAAPPDPGVAPLPRPVPVHGDPVPGNLIVGPGGAASLIDWQCPALADPAEDLAAFLSPAMQRLYRGRPLEDGERAAFLAACPDHVAARYRALAPLLHWRLALHCLWRAARGAPGYAAAARVELAFTPP